ncbi:hypothetical protein DFH28DRAFT_895310, partial [Melampsora americana]
SLQLTKTFLEMFLKKFMTFKIAVMIFSISTQVLGLFDEMKQSCDHSADVIIAWIDPQPCGARWTDPRCSHEYGPKNERWCQNMVRSWLWQCDSCKRQRIEKDCKLPHEVCTKCYPSKKNGDQYGEGSSQG